jgi:hypothetical protein
MLAFARNPRNGAVQKDEYAASSKADSTGMSSCQQIRMPFRPGVLLESAAKCPGEVSHT